MAVTSSCRQDTSLLSTGLAPSRRRLSREGRNGGRSLDIADLQFSKELKQWDRTRGSDSESEDDDTAQYNLPAGNHKQPGQGMKSPALGSAGTAKGKASGGGHKRNSSEYSGDWAQ